MVRKRKEKSLCNERHELFMQHHQSCSKGVYDVLCKLQVYTLQYKHLENTPHVMGKTSKKMFSWLVVYGLGLPGVSIYKPGTVGETLNVIGKMFVYESWITDVLGTEVLFNRLVDSSGKKSWNEWTNIAYSESIFEAIFIPGFL